MIAHCTELLGHPFYTIGACLVAYWLYSYFSFEIKARKNGAQKPIRYNNGILGVPGIFKADRQMKVGTFFRDMKEIYAKAKTVYFPIFGDYYFVSTIDPENVKAILATQFQDFYLGSRKSAMAPLLGQGIFTLDGEGWQHSRALLKPQFAREQVSHLKTLEKHVDVLIDLFRREGKKLGKSKGFDVQPLFYKLTIDTSTEFLFGESVHALTKELYNPGDNLENDFSEAFTTAQQLAAKRCRNLMFYYYYNNKEFKDANKIVHDFTDSYVNKAIELYNSGKLYSEDKTFSYVFMYELVKETRDPKVLRDQLLNILLAGRDTTAVLLSWTLYTLALRPEIWQKLREEILESLGTNTEAITFETLKQCKYLQSVIKEVLRLYPPVPINFRVALHDTTLPRGGGSDGKSPVFVPKDTKVSYTVFQMHRAKEVWGENSEEFIPERWDPNSGYMCGKGWEYLPFNGGPRICLGQQYALAEAGYVLARICQEFSELTSCDPDNGIPLFQVNLTMPHKDGVFVHLQ